MPTVHDRIRRTALIIDHDVWERSHATKLLSDEGYDVLGASNGISGLRLAEQNVCDVILLASSLPELSGSEVLRQLKATAATREVHVVMLGGPSDEKMLRAQLAYRQQASLFEPTRSGKSA
jgi:two-component system, sensor histidine kinase and response regulator